MASLPEVVQRQGVKVSKSTRNWLMVVGLISEDGSMNGDDLRDYAQSNLEKVLSRVPGVGEVEIFGSQYAMRIWFNPDKLTDYQMTVQDVILRCVLITSKCLPGSSAVRRRWRDSDSTPASLFRAFLKHLMNSRRSRFAQILTALSCVSAISGERNLALRCTMSRPITTAGLPRHWRFGRSPAQMPLRRPTTSGRNWRR